EPPRTGCLARAVRLRLPGRAAIGPRGGGHRLPRGHASADHRRPGAASAARRGRGCPARLPGRAARTRRGALPAPRARPGGRGGRGGAKRGAEGAVGALPPARGGALLEPLLGANAGMPGALESSPIVNVHIVYDRPVLDEPFAAGVGTPVQYLFDRTEAAG